MALNYKHLHYFLIVAREGGIIRASEKLNITPQTISGQLKMLEDSVGEQLFQKSGRNLVLTEAGRMTLEYAEDIFALGKELEDVLHQGIGNRPKEFRVGIADVVPKSIAYKFLAPSLNGPQSLRIICREQDLTELMVELAVHQLDMVIADSPIPSSVNVQGYNHMLGSSSIEFFAEPKLEKKLKGQLPHCLDGMPLLLPSYAAAIRQPVLDWLEENDVSPVIAGEFDDTALLKAFGAGGTGVFFVPSIIATEIRRQYNVLSIGKVAAIKQDFYAISVERRITHPAVKLIRDTARDLLSKTA